MSQKTSLTLVHKVSGKKKEKKNVAQHRTQAEVPSATKAETHWSSSSWKLINVAGAMRQLY